VELFGHRADAPIDVSDGNGQDAGAGNEQESEEDEISAKCSRPSTSTV